MFTLTRYFTDANDFLTDRNHVGAALVVIQAAQEASYTGWTSPPGWSRMTTRQRMEALGWTKPAALVRTTGFGGGNFGGEGVGRTSFGTPAIAFGVSGRMLGAAAFTGREPVPASGGSRP